VLDYANATPLTPAAGAGVMPGARATGCVAGIAEKSSRSSDKHAIYQSTCWSSIRAVHGLS
jgi:hypothetical protein